MFFIGVFGIENKDKEIKTLNNISCKNCNKVIEGKLIKNFEFFHFFFIPLFKWNENYYLVCSECKTVYIIPREKGKAIEKGENVEITYWDLQETNADYYDNYSETSSCSYCGKRLDSKFKYCPHCGAKIK